MGLGVYGDSNLDIGAIIARAAKEATAPRANNVTSETNQKLMEQVRLAEERKAEAAKFTGPQFHVTSDLEANAVVQKQLGEAARERGRLKIDITI